VSSVKAEVIARHAYNIPRPSRSHPLTGSVVLSPGGIYPKKLRTTPLRR
jgi:hypothetical protein